LQVSRYLGDRAGLLAIAQLPVVFVFAQRNDPLLWITGWSFVTYNRFHRWVARLCMMLAIVHSVSYSVYTYRAGEGLYAASWVEEYWYCGVIVSCCPKV
jgi:predicted ferric reductase